MDRRREERRLGHLVRDATMAGVSQYMRYTHTNTLWFAPKNDLDVDACGFSIYQHRRPFQWGPSVENDDNLVGISTNGMVVYMQM